MEIDQARFGDWFSSATGRPAAVELAPMKGGGSCEMFSLKQGDEHFVVRKAPVTTVSDSAHNVVREFEIISAMAGSQVRVPELLACSEDDSVLDAPFYIMRYIDGEVIRRGIPEAYQNSPQTQPAIGHELIDALVELHAFEWRGTALEKLAKPERFLQRQVQRWMNQLEGYRNRDIDGIDAVAQWLETHRPQSGDLTVMHGDYKIDNAMYSKTLPPTILSLVDFEMTTIGDPLIDLAWCITFWPEPGNDLAIAAPGSPKGMDADACQQPQQLIDRYASATGRDISSFTWYQAFAAWKLAIVLEASYAKFLAGKSKNPNHEFFGYVIDQLMQRAQRFAC